MDTSAVERHLREVIRDVPDFPKPGILFRDITTLLKDPESFRMAVEALAEPYRSDPPEYIVGVESRGFIFGGPLAYELGSGLVIVRKPGKLPAETETVSYELEYGEDSLEIHRDAIEPGRRALVVDDLIATGGTARGTAQLIEKIGGEVEGLAFLIELTALEGRKLLDGWPIHTVLRY